MGTKRPTAAIVAVLTAAIAAGTLTVAGPAVADPKPGTFGTYVGVGSDTTQDVLNALAGSVLPNVASYDATGSATIKTRANGVDFTRPNGSGAGQKALSASLIGDKDPSGTANIAGQVDFARSSGAPSTAGTTLIYIPFGRDAVGYVAKGDFLKNLTPTQLKEIYSGSVVSVAGHPVRPFIPQSSSGTRKFFLSAIGVTNLGSNVKETTDGGKTVEENQANDIVLQDGDLVPFSAASWIAQNNLTAPDRSSTAAQAGAFIGSVDLGTGTPVSPVVKGADGKLSPAGTFFDDPTFGRDVYNVVPTRAVDTSSAFFDKGLYDTFVSSGSHKAAIASDDAEQTIAAFGFKNEPYNGTVDTSVKGHAKLGGLETNSSSLIKPPAVGGLTVGAPAPRQLKVSWTAPADPALPVTDYRVLITDSEGAVAFATDVKAPATSVTAELAPGSYTAEVYASNLVGDGPSLTAAGTVSDVPKTASKITAALSPAKAAYGASVKLSVTVGGSSTATGKVTVKDGATTLGTPTLDGAGKASLTLPKTLAVGTHTLAVSYAGDSKLNASTASAKLTVTKAASKTQVTVSRAKPAYGTSAKLSLSATGPATATGKITVKDGSTKLGTVTLDKNGRGSLTLSRTLKVGTHTLAVSYAGDSRLNASSAKIKVTVVKAAPKVSASAPASVKTSARAKVKVTVTATGVVPGGKVKVYDGKKVVGTATLKNGKAVVTLAKLKKGKHSLKLAYAGSGTVKSGSKKFTVTAK
ncbi:MULTISPECIES: Ig-like domain repeat protein [unclassified Streptomyces]|uniref:Ig-like domain repeat protein n=1 Tax=unclassified Streptomyces TaxID=2593676 RepID=UPI002E2A89E3|nr:Ig-like domain repeat protein [Streptomyces sp. NBC_00223]